MPGMVCGVDIGGTFTDCVLVDEDGRVAYGKALSSPADSFKSGFFGSIESAGDQLGLAADELYTKMDRLISHGSTVATNIVVERKGAAIGLITTRGFEDTVRTMRGLGRPTGEPPENLLRFAETRKPEPLVPIERTFGVAERIDSDGDVVVALDEDGGRRGRRRAARRRASRRSRSPSSGRSATTPTSGAPARSSNERAPGVFVTISSEISKSVGEYERFVATLINSYVGPVTSTYLHGVQDRLADVGFAGELHIMQCHGGMVPLGLGADRPIFTIGSGPVGGLIGCARVADDLGRNDIIASDMGGTSFDVGIIKDGEPLAADDTLLGKWRYRVPAVEVISIGAGGGSIAWIDELGGGLRVGPQSASSLPGPCCYDRGGEEPTVTDADLILGYIAPEATFGSKGERGGFKPRRDLAEKAIKEKIADPLGLSRHRRRARHRRGRQREDGGGAGERDHRPRLRPARLRPHVLRRRRPLPRRGLRGLARRRDDRRPRRGGLGLVGLRHLPGRHPLPVRILGRPDRAVRPRRGARRLRRARGAGPRGALRPRGRRRASSSAASPACASSGSGTSSR